MMRPSMCRTAIITLLVLAFAAALVSGCQSRDPWQGVTAASFARVNEQRLRGIALLENGQTLDAAAEFEAIAKARPRLAFGHVNAAVARMRQPGQAGAALASAQKGAELLPGAAWPKLVLARAFEMNDRPDDALQALEAAMKAAPDDPRVVGALARRLDSSRGDHSARLYELRQRLVELAPENLAAQLHLLVAQAERKDYTAARKTLERIKALLVQVPPPAREPLASLEQKLAGGTGDLLFGVRVVSNLLHVSPQYTPAQNALYGSDADPADLVMRDWGTPPPQLPPPELGPITVTWKDVSAPEQFQVVRASGTAPVSAGDVELSAAGGRLAGGESAPFQARSVFMCGAGGNPLVMGKVLDVTRPYDGSGSPLLLDLNDDYTLDAYLASREGDRIWKNARAGKIEESGLELTPAKTEPFLAAGSTPGKGPGAPMAADLDQDGDLDIIRASGDPGQPAVRYLRNNGNFTFTDLTASSGLTAPSGGARQAVFGDFDADGDPDLFVVRADAAPLLFLNRRQDRFREAAREWGIQPASGSRAAVVGDFDRDGDWDVAVAGEGEHGTLLYRNTGKRFEADPAALAAAGGANTWIDLLDYDNDTWLDLAVAGPGGVRLLHNRKGQFEGAGLVVPEPAVWLKALDRDQDGDMDLLLADRAGQLRLMSNEGGNARPWLRMELQGIQKHGAATNNTYAIGAVIEPQTAWDQQKILVTTPTTHVGLGGAEQAVAVRTMWTNGVPLDAVAPGTRATLHFVQTTPNSCPFLYSWDGTKWQFITDFTWRSPLGMLAARGKLIPHDQTLDWVKLPGDLLKPENGHLSLIATEEVREISYFDQIRLLAVDHPGDVDIYVDERFKFGPPDPFRIYTARHRRLPRSARDETGADLLPALQTVDARYTPVPEGPYQGIRAPHDLILDLGDVPDPANVKLFLNGWIFPSATSSNVGSAQNPDVKIIPPTLYVGDGRGGWTGADATIGLPCGKRKTIVLDLSGKLVGRDHRVKLTTTMEIRWDAAFFTSGEATAPLRQSAVPLAGADLRERGYSTRYHAVPDGPFLYDYNLPIRPNWAPDWGLIPGAYTRLGDCAELLQQVDDRYAIIGPGDEVRLSFDGRTVPEPPRGWKRDFIVLSDGWTKDSDKNTVAGEQVEPLPFHGMKRYPYGTEERFPNTPAHHAWQRDWNTRLKGER
jgi:cytochrome c-type biogenesis protein CcmH/NrfG